MKTERRFRIEGVSKERVDQGLVGEVEVGRKKLVIEKWVKEKKVMEKWVRENRVKEEWVKNKWVK